MRSEREGEPMDRFTQRSTRKDVPPRSLLSGRRGGVAVLLAALAALGLVRWRNERGSEPVAGNADAPRTADARVRSSGDPANALPVADSDTANAVASPSHPDFGAVMQQVHFAFRGRGRGHEARHSTYAVDAEGGRVRLTPYRYPDADGARASEPIAGEPLTLATAAVARDGRPLATDPPSQSLGERGRLEIARGELVETWTNGPEGSEQAWRFAVEPIGRGDLVVSVDVEGLGLVGSTASGLHFADATGFGFRYGTATWVDARGIRTTVAPTFEDGRIVMRVPGSVVADSSYPAVLDPIVGPEFGMDIPQTGPAAFDQSAPAVAFDGTNYLVAWQDYRSGTSYDIYAARVGPAGAVLDGSGLAVSTATGSQRTPAVAFDGTNYLVVWEDARSGTADIYGSRVTPDGGVLDGAGIAINASSGVQQAPSVAFLGTRYLVAWQDHRSGTNDDVYATRVSTAGAVLDGTGVAVSAGTANQVAPAVSAGGANFLVVWSDARGTDADVYAARVNATGSVLDAAGVALSAATGDQTAPSVDFDGTNFLVAWSDTRGSDADIYATRVSAAGAVLDATGIAVSTVAGAQSAPIVDFDGAVYFVAWQDQRSGTSWDLYGTRVSTAGALLDGAAGWAITTGTGDQQAPALATNGAGVGILAYDGPFAPAGGTLRTIARRFCAAGVALTDTTCDGFDDDCDGLIDDEYAVVQTDCGIGACHSTGNLTCVSGAEVDTCVAGTGTAADTVCNDVDDDCDGQVDEDITPTPTNCGVGGCARTGLAYCISGVISDSCVPGTPAADDSVCNGVDDDCNSQVDEDYVAPPTSCGVGACLSSGTAACINGVITNTCVAGTPAANDTVCNGIDDDCNNQVDEDYVPVSTSCGFGVCVSSGTAWCASGAISDTCTPLAPPSTTDATCDGFDDDCSGAADEDYVATPTSCGVGACARTGAMACVSGSVSNTCVAGVPAANDANCNGIDDDCNGQVDEDYVAVATMCGVGACARMGTTSCVMGSVQDSCTPGTPAASDATCNGIDNDCNGQVDEDYPVVTTSCGVGACASTGTRSCVNGMVVNSCMAGTPAASDVTCDGVDDNCNGTRDEGYVATSTSCGVGACARTGTTSCVSGTVHDSCTVGAPTGPETDCDNVDDDCDGTADEDYVGLTTHCGAGLCASTGHTSCVSGTVQNSCMPGTPGTLDADCDGLDDDCDGMVDEDAVCPADGGVDASTSDGSIMDAGADASVTPAQDSGCSCAVNGPLGERVAGTGLPLLLFALATASRRRRSR